MSFKIGHGCSTCHYCFRSCPVQAIRFVGREYAIDEAVCIGCGKCAEVCPSGIIYDTEAKDTVKKHKPHSLKTNLVVLGAGGAGLIAAVRFKQLTGKDVIVLEKAKKAGGNTTLGHNFLTRYSKKHEQIGMPDLREEAIKSIIAGGSGKDLSENLLRKAMYAQTDALNWLFEISDLDKHMTMVDLRDRISDFGPFPFTPGFLDFPKRIANLKSTDHSMGPGWMGTFLIKTMMSECKKLGIDVMRNHKAIDITMDNEGTFQSVTAENPGGIAIIEADYCLIATGGFARNKEVISEIMPEFYEGVPVHTFTVASNTGDAIAMAKKIGAKLDFKHIKLPMFGPVHHPFSFPVLNLCNNPQAVMVTLEGKRFKNEAAPPDMSMKGPLEKVKDKIAYAVFDSRIRDAMGEELLQRSAENPEFFTCVKHWKEELEYEATLDMPVKKADSIKELAELAGINIDTFITTISDYNKYCELKIDNDFNKPASFLKPVITAPFYAVYLGRFNEGAEGGIVNDDNLRVIKEDGTPFKGLYIAGDPCRGVLKQDDEGGKMGEMPWAVGSGFLVAQNIADELRAESS